MDKLRKDVAKATPASKPTSSKAYEATFDDDDDDEGEATDPTLTKILNENPRGDINWVDPREGKSYGYMRVKREIYHELMREDENIHTFKAANEKLQPYVSNFLTQKKAIDACYTEDFRPAMPYGYIIEELHNKRILVPEHELNKFPLSQEDQQSHHHLLKVIESEARAMPRKLGMSSGAEHRTVSVAFILIYDTKQQAIRRFPIPRDNKCLKYFYQTDGRPQHFDNLP
ncbi:MAG: hypothetical protein Q9162_006461 [Coniocarpon cinnabarinum]